MFLHQKIKPVKRAFSIISISTIPIAFCKGYVIVSFKNMPLPDLTGLGLKALDNVVHGKHGRISIDESSYEDPLETTEGLQAAINHTSRRFGQAPWRHSNMETMLGRESVQDPDLRSERILEGDQLGKRIASLMQRGITQNDELKELTYDPRQNCIRPVGIFDFITPPPHIPSLLSSRSDITAFFGNELIPWFHNVSDTASKHALYMLKHPMKTAMDALEEVWPYSFVLAVTGDPIRKMTEQTQRIREGLPEDHESVAMTVEDAMRFVTGRPNRSQERNAVVRFVEKWAPKVIAFASMSETVDRKLDDASIALLAARPVKNARRATSVLGAKFLPALNGFTIRKTLDARLYAGEFSTVQSMYNAFARGYRQIETVETGRERDFYTKVWAQVMRDPFNANFGYRMPIVGSLNLYRKFRRKLLKLENKERIGTLSDIDREKLEMGRMLRATAQAARLRASGEMPTVTVQDIQDIKQVREAAILILTQKAVKSTGATPDQLNEQFTRASEPADENVSALFGSMAQSLGYADYNAYRNQLLNQGEGRDNQTNDFSNLDTFLRAVDALHAAEVRGYDTPGTLDAVNEVARQFGYNNMVEMKKAMWRFVQNTGDGTLEGADQDVLARAVGYPDAAAMKAAHASSEPFQAQTVEAPSSDALMDDLEKQQ